MSLAQQLDNLFKTVLLESLTLTKDQIFDQILKFELNKKKETIFQTQGKEAEYLKIKPNDVKTKDEELYNLAKEYTEYVIETDPTDGDHSQAIINWYKNGSMILENGEDVEVTRQVLEVYEQNKDKLKNPFNFQKRPDFNKQISEFIKKTSIKSTGNEYSDLPVDFSNNDVTIYRIEGDYDEKKCKRWMKDTDWCVQYPNMYNKYGPPFYMLVDKHNGEKFLFHVPSVQFKNKNDQFNLDELKKYKEWVILYFEKNQEKIQRISDFGVISLIKTLDQKLLQKIAENPDHSFAYAKALGFKNIPQEILQKFAEDYNYSFAYAKALGFKNVPQEILQGISKNDDYSFKYAEALGFKNVPKEIIWGVSRSFRKAFLYADMLEFKNIPPEIEKAYGGIRGLAASPANSFAYAKALGFKNVPKEIILGITPDRGYSLEYAKALGYKNVPAPIVTAIHGDSSYTFGTTIDDNWDKSPTQESFTNNLQNLFFEEKNIHKGMVGQNDEALARDIVDEYMRVQGMDGSFPDNVTIRVSELSSKSVDQAEKILDIELFDEDMLNVFWKDASSNDISRFPTIYISLELEESTKNKRSLTLLSENIEKKRPFIMQQLENGLKKNKIKISDETREDLKTNDSLDNKDLAEYLFKWISNLDPTVVESKGQKSEYVNYILSWVLDGSVIYDEDSGKIKQAIDKIIEIKESSPKALQTLLKNNQGKLSLKDLNTIKIDEIGLNDYEQSLTKSYDKELEKVWENGPYKIYKIDKFIPAKELKDKYCEGQGVHKFFAFTKWCVRCEGTFNSYLDTNYAETEKNSSFYIVLQNNKRIALLHPGTAQAKDINDDEVDIKLLHTLKPFLNDHIMEMDFAENGELSQAMTQGVYDADRLLNYYEENGLQVETYGNYDSTDVMETLLDVYFKQKPLSERIIEFALKNEPKILFEFCSNNGISFTNTMTNFLNSLETRDLRDYLSYIAEKDISESMWDALLENDDEFFKTLAFYTPSSLPIVPNPIKKYLFYFIDKEKYYAEPVVQFIRSLIIRSKATELLDKEDFDKRFIRYLLDLMKNAKEDSYEISTLNRTLKDYLEKITNNYKDYSNVPYLKEIYDTLLPYNKNTFELKGFTGNEEFSKKVEEAFL